MSQFRITPAEVARAAGEFTAGQERLGKAWSVLGSVLSAQTGMAGDDQFAMTFLARYQRAADAAWAAFGTAGSTLGGISRGLAQTARNYLKADHDSAVGGSGQVPDVADPASSAAVCIPVIDNAAGPGETGLPGPLARFWPNASTAKLRGRRLAGRRRRGRAGGGTAEQRHRLPDRHQ
jgi:hypothetical protein